MLSVQPHALLDLVALETVFSAPLSELSSAAIRERLLGDAPLHSDDERAAIRRLLKSGGFKATGRNKPSSEYLAGAVERGALPEINVAVDAGNAVSRLSGLPISVVDADRLAGPAQVLTAPAGSAFVFNASGQTIDVGGLLSLVDSEGPCANAVKDSQRTKTHAGTRRTWTLIWGSVELPGRTEAAARVLEELLAPLGPVRRLAAY